MGSAFFYELNGDSFLITNRHNITGKDVFEKKPLLPNGRFPEYLLAKLAFYLPGNTAFTMAAHRVEIYDRCNPLWFEHPELGSSCDVVALPLNPPENCPPLMHRAVNMSDSTKIPIWPGTTVFIIGFPRSISIGAGLPVWKSGYIASEPSFDIIIGGKPSLVGGPTGGIKIPAFFIDSQTREGMSGCPIFASYTGIWDPEDLYGLFTLKESTNIGTGLEFIGCYSGRVTSQEQGAALGLCWRRDIIGWWV